MAEVIISSAEAGGLQLTARRCGVPLHSVQVTARFQRAIQKRASASAAFVLDSLNGASPINNHMSAVWTPGDRDDAVKRLRRLLRL